MNGIHYIAEAYIA